MKRIGFSKAKTLFTIAVFVIAIALVMAICYYQNIPKYPGCLKQLNTYEALQHEIGELSGDILFPELKKYGFKEDKYYLHTLSEYDDSKIDGYRIDGFTTVDGKDYDYSLSVFKGYNERIEQSELINGNKAWIETIKQDSTHAQVNCELQVNEYTYEIISFIEFTSNMDKSMDQLAKYVQNSYIDMFNAMTK